MHAIAVFVPALRQLALAALLLLTVAMPTEAQTAAAEQYERVFAREDVARATPSPALATLRAVASSYEAIVRRYPRSGYADNALWQAAGLLQLAYARFGQPADREKATGLLAWLRKEYPSSSLARLDAPVAGADDPAAASSSLPTLAATPTPTPPPPPGSVAPLPPGGGASVRAITHTTLPQGDRITIELTQEVPYVADRIGDPDRIFVDLANTSTAASVIERAVSSVSGRLVRSTRVGVHPDGTSRVVLDVTGRPRYSSFPLYNPFRLVIDVESEGLAATSTAPLPRPAGADVVAKAADVPRGVATTSALPRNLAPPVARPTPPPTVTPAAASASASASVSAPASAPVSAPPPATADVPPMPSAPAVTSRGEYSIARQLGLRVSRVVIDPGHGGHDPGARANGLTEADLVLDVALRLDALLREEGVDVVMTRRTNTFVPLEERTAIANRVGADLFVSIHANASSRTATSGIETYFLNFATNKQAEALAARENASSAKTMATLPTLLRAIALNNKLAESRELASMVQTSLVRTMSAGRKPVNSLGVKQAPFVVLIGAQMPSILAEVGFITNRPEAAVLKLPAGREQVAQGLFAAIVKYQAALKAAPAVALRQEGR
jgi:N-acetylmuramoyl-L-alanine amidase